MKHIVKSYNGLPKKIIGNNRNMFILTLPDAPKIDPSIAWRSNSEKDIAEAINSGKANGGVNVWYSNRDGGHANVYRDTDERRNILVMPQGDHPNHSRLVSNGLVLENASVAFQGVSVTRFQTEPPWAQTPTEAMYRSGILMFNPEHLDFDKTDNFAVLSPYVMTSIGSSGSEKDHVKQCYTIASLINPTYWKWLLDNNKATGAIMSLFLCSLEGGYLSDYSHKPAINRTTIKKIDKNFIDYITSMEKMPFISIDTEDQVDIGKTSQAIYLTEKNKNKKKSIRVKAFSDGSMPLEWHIKPINGKVNVTVVESNDYEATVDIEFINNGMFYTERSDGLTQLSRRSDVLISASSNGYFSPPCYISYYVPFGQETPVSYKTVKLSEEIEFDGTRGIETSFIGNQEAVSMSCWFKLNGKQGSDTNIISARQSNNSQVSVRLEPEGFDLVNGRKSTKVNATLLEWNHVAVTANATETLFYLNGKQIHKTEGIKLEDVLWELAIAKSRYGIELKGFIRNSVWYFGPVWSSEQISEMASKFPNDTPDDTDNTDNPLIDDEKDEIIRDLRETLVQVRKLADQVQELVDETI